MERELRDELRERVYQEGMSLCARCLNKTAASFAVETLQVDQISRTTALRELEDIPGNK